jgi:hypothetical protein
MRIWSCIIWSFDASGSLRIGYVGSAWFAGREIAIAAAAAA